MEETQEQFMLMLITMVFQKKPVKLMKLKTYNTLIAQIFKDVKIALLL